jgi:ABC-type nitrate/sulfonate/bicarbonate transport system ATPase subunit
MGEQPPAKLAVRDLGKVFHDRGGEFAALDDVTLEVGDGEFVALIGPSGAGKSTLCRILAGLAEPTCGSVALGGREDVELLGRVGYMPQRDTLLPWRTVLDNAALGLVLRGVPAAAAREAARAELARFGLHGFGRSWPAALSGGMRQRAALLRTFLAGADVMLLDEPFGALDALTRQSMQAWLLGVWETRRTTILFVTHDLEEAIFLSDRVLVMSGPPGRIVRSERIDLPRPRAVELTVTPEFVAHKRRLLDLLREPWPLGTAFS